MLYIMVLSEVTVAEDIGNKKELRHCTQLRDLELNLSTRRGSVLEGVPYIISIKLYVLYVLEPVTKDWHALLSLLNVCEQLSSIGLSYYIAKLGMAMCKDLDKTALSPYHTHASGLDRRHCLKTAQGITAP